MAFFELEQAILAYHAIDDCVVVNRPGLDRHPEPVAYVVAKEPIDSEELRAHLRSILPAASLPPVVRTHAIPTTPEGEVDMGALEATPTLDGDVCRKAEDTLKGIPGVIDALSGFSERDPQVPHLHLHDILPGSGWQLTQPELERVSTTRPPNRTGTTEREPRSYIQGPDISSLPVETLLDLFERTNESWPKQGIVHLNESLDETFVSYGALKEEASRILSGLRGAGMAVGDLALLDLPNREAFLATFWACVLGGFVPVPVTGTQDATEGQLVSEKIRGTWEFLDRPIIIRKTAPGMSMPDYQDPPEDRGIPPRFAWYDDLRRADRTDDFHRSEPGDPALMVMTSGSTGVPKGVVLSHKNIVAQAVGTNLLLEITPADVFVNIMPLEHVGGIVLTHIDAVLQGCTQVQLPTTILHSDPLKWLEIIQERRGSITWVPNFAIGLVLDHLPDLEHRRWDLSCLRHLLNGSEPVVPATTRKFVRVMADHGFKESAMVPVWGMSETAAGAVYSQSFSLASTADGDPNTALGVPIPGFSVRVVDAENETLAQGEVGHVQVRGDAVSKAYHKRPELAAEVFTADGWFRTGDLGSISVDGLTLTGRSKDIIILNGVNYGSHEIEAVVEGLEDVMSSFTAAISVQAVESFTDQLAVFFCPSKGMDAVDHNLLRRIQGQIAAKVGSPAEFLIPVEPGEIPKTDIGKIQRSVLKSLFEEGAFLDAAKRSDLLQRNHRTLPNWFFKRVWKRKELRGAVQHPTGNNVVVFLGSPNLEVEVLGAFQEGGWNCAVVYPGQSFRELGDNRFEIDPHHSPHYVTLSNLLSTSGFSPDVTLHLWSHGVGGHVDSDGGGLEEIQALGALSLIRWVQAQANQSPGLFSAHRVVVGANGLFRHSPEDPVIFQVAPILGFSKAIPFEFPGWDSRVIDLGGSRGEGLGRLLLNEATQASSENEVAFRGGSRWVRRLQRLSSPPGDASPLPFRKGGRYVILGGSGPLGREIGQRLRDDFDADLLLIGRSPPRRPDRDQERTSYKSLDFGIDGELSSAICEAEGRWGGPVEGIVHVADDAKPLDILSEDEDSFRVGMHAKLDGMVAVSRVLLERPDCHFIAFSSASSLFGGSALGAYSGANSTLEAATEALAAGPGVTRTSVAWPMWRVPTKLSRGWERAFEANQDFFEATIPVTPPQAWASLLSILQTGETNVLAGLNEKSPLVRRFLTTHDVAAEELRGFYTFEGSGGFDPVPLHIKLTDRFGVPFSVTTVKVSDLPDLMPGTRLPKDSIKDRSNDRYVPPRNSLERLLTSIWSSVLNRGKIGIEDDFLALGGNSLMATQLVSTIRAVCQVEIGVHTLFEHSRISDLAPRIRQAGARELDPQELHEVLAILEGQD